MMAYEMRISDWSSDVCSSESPLRVLRAVEKIRVPDDRELRSIEADEPAELTQPLILHLLSERLEVRPRGREIEALARLQGAARVGARRGRIERIHVLLAERSEEHTSELQSLMRISYAVFCLQKKK